MHRAIGINGARLDQVQMLLEPYGNGSQGSLSYPKSQFRISGSNDTLRLVVPAYLAVELYRRAILPQNASLPVEISIGGSAAGWFTVSDVRYLSDSDAQFSLVGLMFARVPQGQASDKPRRPASVAAADGGAYSIGQSSLTVPQAQSGHAIRDAARREEASAHYVNSISKPATNTSNDSTDVPARSTRKSLGPLGLATVAETPFSTRKARRFRASAML